MSDSPPKEPQEPIAPLAESSPTTTRAWFKGLTEPRHRGRLILLSSIVLVVIGASLAAYQRYFASEPAPAAVTEGLLPTVTVAEAETRPSSLDGTSVSPELADQRPLAVMIENHPDARPQAGLSEAGAVWEAMVEGGITRFMALYAPRSASKIGPVRSARTQYLHWAAGYKALYAHAGGSQGALALIPTLSGIVDLPHTAAYFHREPQPGIASEHTLFTSTSELYDFAKEKGASLTADFGEIRFSQDGALADRPASASVSVDFSTDSYKVDWTYDREKNHYTRSLAGSPHVDKVSGDQLTAKNIVVLVVERSFNPNTNQGKGEWTYVTEGAGKVYIFHEGIMSQGTWKKERKDTLLKLYYEHGEEIPLVAGATWYEVIPPDREAFLTHSETAVDTSTEPSA
ncbi:DUF3048 domain-containing protein [Candidatus Berkelbacteria bacterium]|nr:DUF3048 domain-containing protein [Candidatus Berkelbacteria bacterium]